MCSRRRLIVLLAAVLILSPGAARADAWLVLLVDRSNSIDAGELRLQREAYVRVLTDPDVQRRTSSPPCAASS